MKKEFQILSLEHMLQFGASIGKQLRGGEILEMTGDVGSGKTSFIKGLAKGMDISDVVQSPTFTISRVYEASNTRRLIHYDFYRLREAGIMRDELAEALTDKAAVIAIEWDDSVRDILPDDRTIRMNISYSGDQTRSIYMHIPTGMAYVLEAKLA